MIENQASGLVQPIVDDFTNLYFSAYDRTWMNTFWLGVPVQKCPLDLWVYQEIVHEVKPDLVIETGTLFGGSAFYFASLFDLLNQGQILTIDIEAREGRPEHPRITYLQGSSTDDDVVGRVAAMIKPGDTVMVILDSDHSAEHVLNELRIYHRFVTKNSYLIVEDTCMNGHPILSGIGAGPMEAAEEFLKERADFVVDESREKFFVTWNPQGFLRRVS